MLWARYIERQAQSKRCAHRFHPYIARTAQRTRKRMSERPRPHIETHTRSSQQSATRGAAYRFGICIAGSTAKRAHDFSKRAGVEVVFSDTIAPKGAPAWGHARHARPNLCKGIPTRMVGFRLQALTAFACFKLRLDIYSESCRCCIAVEAQICDVFPKILRRHPASCHSQSVARERYEDRYKRFRRFAVCAHDGRGSGADSK